MWKVCNISSAKTQVVSTILEVILPVATLKNLLSNGKTGNYIGNYNKDRIFQDHLKDFTINREKIVFFKYISKQLTGIKIQKKQVFFL